MNIPRHPEQRITQQATAASSPSPLSDSQHSATLPTATDENSALSVEWCDASVTFSLAGQSKRFLCVLNAGHASEPHESRDRFEWTEPFFVGEPPYQPTATYAPPGTVDDIPHWDDDQNFQLRLGTHETPAERPE